MKRKMAKRMPRKNISLVMQNIDYAKNIARQFYRQRSRVGVDVEDFEGAALLGLCDAASRFDLTKGMKFSTYAYFRIRGTMFDLLSRGGGVSWVFSSRPMFSSPSHQEYPLDVSSAIRAKKAMKEDNQHVGILSRGQDQRDATLFFPRQMFHFIRYSEILAHVGMQPHLNKFREIEDVSYLENSTPEEIAVGRQTMRTLKRLIGHLSEEERRVVELRYYQGLTFEEIQTSFGASKSWVSRLHGKALDTLRDSIEYEHAQKKQALLRQAA